jgi:hypothetical protein
MAMRRSTPTRSLGQQAFALRDRFPSGRITIVSSELRWEGQLTPTAISRTYSLRLRYRLGSSPAVRVVAPQLRARSGEGLPHVYEDGSLCLHLDTDWNGTMRLADSIVPWAAEWLFFYELWLPSGEWHGGGEWPPMRSLDDSNACQRRSPADV